MSKHKPVEDIDALTGDFSTAFIGKSDDTTFSFMLSMSEMTTFNTRSLETSSKHF
jgi:hypothetical protein